jgi:thiol-disulfide isomerase/thioredoxin
LNDDTHIESSAAAAGGRRGAFWPMFALLVAAAGVLIALQSRQPRRPGPFNEWVGRALPPLEVAGWMNTDRPLSAEDLRGKVVLADFWATWCQPCLRGMPELAEFHERFGKQGVVVIGLTEEPAEAAERVQQVIDRTEIDWPIGYGAGLAFEALGIYGIPTYVLYDRTGHSVWGGHSLEGAEEAAVAALARD